MVHLDVCVDTRVFVNHDSLLHEPERFKTAKLLQNKSFKGLEPAHLQVRLITILHPQVSLMKSRKPLEVFVCLVFIA